MKRFLLVLALVAVAGATYVAMASGSQTAAGPSAKQFKALKKQVAGLSKQVKGVQNLAVAEAIIITDCMQISGPINLFGDTQNATPTYGYSFSDPNINSGTPFPMTALNVTTPDDPSALWITGGSSSCATDINGQLVRKVSRLAGAHRHAAPSAFSAFRH
jgi:hypothetical protein